MCSAWKSLVSLIAVWCFVRRVHLLNFHCAIYVVVVGAALYDARHMYGEK